MNLKTTIFRLPAFASLSGRLRLQYLPLLCALEACAGPAFAATLPSDLIGATKGFLEQSVAEYLQRSEIQGRHEIRVNSLDPRLRLAACDTPLAVTLESPAQPIGRVTCRVRCDGVAPWTVFVPGQVRLYRPVLVATRPLKRNAQIQPGDVVLAERDVGQLSQGYLTDLSQTAEKKLTRAMQTDQVLTSVHLTLAEVIRKGDHVVIGASSGAISVRMPGEALSNGSPGEQIRVRNLRSQRIIRARVTGPGAVEVQM